MFDRVPFGSPGGVVANRNRQAAAVSHPFLQLLLPDFGPATIAAASIGFNHQVGCLGEACWHLGLTPVGDIVHGKGRRISRLTDIHGSLVVLQVIDAIRGGTPHRILWKIIDIHYFGRLTPYPAGILEITYQLFFLGIHADDRLPGSLVFAPLVKDVLKLVIPVWVLLARPLFRITAQAIVALVE